jgi:hypothetical protein
MQKAAFVLLDIITNRIFAIGCQLSAIKPIPETTF